MSEKSIRPAGKDFFSSSFDPEDFDLNTKHDENFYFWCNGGWIQRISLPEDQKKWNIMSVQKEMYFHKMKIALDELMEKDIDTLDIGERKLLDFYRTFMDENRLLEVGLGPLMQIIELCENIPDDMTDTIVQLHSDFGINALFAVCSIIEKRSSNKTAGAVFIDTQWGYATFTARQQKIVCGATKLLEDDILSSYSVYIDLKKHISDTRYTQYVNLVFSLLATKGVRRYEDSAHREKIVSEVIKLKDLLARDGTDYTSPSHVFELADFDKLTNLTDPRNLPLTWKQYLTRGPSRNTSRKLDWRKYFELLGRTEESMGKIQVPNLDSLKNLAEVVNSPYLSDYLILQVIESFSADLPDSFVNVFYSHFGRTKNQPRWKRVIQATEEYFGDAMGKLYVDKYVKPGMIQHVQSVVGSITEQMARRLDEVDWLSEETREEGRDKLRKMQAKISHPDKWESYVGMTFNVPGNSGHLDNVIRIRHFFFRKEIEKINRPTDRSLWLCSPATVNAFYHPALNEIVLPAAFLQSPMFDSSADLAVQYGSLGAMIGHEISHGFDKIGRRYDGDGNLRDWWKPKDVEEYSKREQAMVLQMNKYNVEMGFHGDLTLGENLADLSGLSLASGAFAKILLRDDISLETRIDGFTPWQRFYVSWARSWREIDNESEKPSLRFKSHSPNEFRCNNPLKNISRVYETFDIQPKSGMYLLKGDRTELW